MIDIEVENLIPFRDVPQWTKEHLGRRVHPSTVHRWRLRGARGVKLEAILAGGTRYTSTEAIYRFFAAVTAAADGKAYFVETPVPDLKSAQQVLDAEVSDAA